MKKLLILCLLPTLSFAQVERSTCLSQANKKGSSYQVDKTCLDYAKKESKLSLVHENAELKIKAYGWNNILFIDKEVLIDDKLVKQVGIINGPNTLIQNIQAVQLSPDGKEVFILNQKPGDKEILVFKSDRSGNVKPRTIQHPSLFSAKGFTIGNNDQLYILNNDEVTVVGAKSNSRSKLDSKKPQITRFVKDDKLKDADQIYFADENILVLDKKNSNLIVVDKVNRSVASSISLKENELEAPTHIKYDKKDKSFKVYNKDSFVKFK